MTGGFSPRFKMVRKVFREGPMVAVTHWDLFIFADLAIFKVIERKMQRLRSEPTAARIPLHLRGR